MKNQKSYKFPQLLFGGTFIFCTLVTGLPGANSGTIESRNERDSNTKTKVSVPFNIWGGGSVPASADIPVLHDVTFSVIQPHQPEKDGYRWLHGVALAWHNGRLYASFGHNKGLENTGGEQARGRYSEDAGKTWSPVFTIATGDEHLGVSHGVFLSHEKALWSFHGAFYDDFQQTHTRAFILDEKSGQWRPKGIVVKNGFWPLQEPVKMDDGNWIMAGARIAKGYDVKGNLPAVAISHGDDFTRWDLVVIPCHESVAPESVWGESAVMVDGGRMLNVARWGDKNPTTLVSESSDYGRTWSPARAGNLPMADSKPCCGTLSTGQNYLICTTAADAGRRRYPLTIAVSHPGEDAFSELFVIRHALLDQGPGESHANAMLAYPSAIEHDGKLYIGYSNSGGRGGNNNSAELAIIPVAALATYRMQEARFVAMTAEQIRDYEIDVMRKIADLTLIPPTLNTTPLPDYDYDRLDYGMTIGIERTPGGRLWAVWVAGEDGPGAFMVAAKSDDDGATWSKPCLVVDSQPKHLPFKRSVIVGNLWTDPLGRLWFFFDQVMNHFDGRGGLWATICDHPDADKPEWSAPRRIWHGSMLNKPTVLSTGEWILPVQLLDHTLGIGPFANIFPELDPLRGANVFVSTDQGKTWERRGCVRFPNPDWYEHMIVERRDGSLWMLGRTAKGIIQTFSNDGGRTWSEPGFPENIRHPNARFHFRRLASGRILLVKHGDTIDAHEGRVKLSAWLSDDEGLNWRGGLILDERSGVSYPDGFQAPDGTIYISYDRNRSTDGEILLARFTEKDILAGKLVGPKSKLGMLISRPMKNRQPVKGLDTFVHPPVHFAPGNEYGPEARKYQGIPSLERTKSGRLWAVWYAGKVHEDRYNYVVGVTSGDNGKTWSDLQFVIDPDGDGPMRTSDPCLWLDPDNRLWLFWWLNGPDELATVTMAMSTDNPDDENPKWSQPRVICNGVMINKPIVLHDGDWLLPTAIWHTENSCRVVASSDKGRTWVLRGSATVANPAERNCDEPMIVERRDNSLLMLVRTNFGIGRAFSMDRGYTWTQVERFLPDATARFFFRRLASGHLLLIKHGPLHERIGRTHLTAYLSKDDGQTWQGGFCLDKRATVSYPDGMQAPDGTIYIIYDWNRADDKHILLAAFTEQDVLAGKPVSDAVRLCVLVNRATGINPKPWLKEAHKK